MQDKKKVREKHRLQRFLIHFSLPLVVTISGLMTFGGLVVFFVFLFYPAFFRIGAPLDIDLSVKFGTFFQGLVGTIFSAAGALLVASTFLYQSISNKKNQVEQTFMRLVDYHRDNVTTITFRSYMEVTKPQAEPVVGKRAFVFIKLQIYDCIEAIKRVNVENKYKLDELKVRQLAYLIVYYGLDEHWRDFTLAQFSAYPSALIDELEIERKRLWTEDEMNIGRTNQTFLSSYFRNMYNAIRYVDEDVYLTSIEKYQLVKLYRAQLTNSELVVFFYNIESHLGKSWKSFVRRGKEIDHNLIEKYQLIKNIPTGYIKGLDHRKLYSSDYEDDEFLRDI